MQEAMVVLGGMLALLGWSLHSHVLSKDKEPPYRQPKGLEEMRGLSLLMMLVGVVSFLIGFIWAIAG